MVVGQLLIIPTVEICIQKLVRVKEIVWLPYDASCDTEYLACAEPLRRTGQSTAAKILDKKLDNYFCCVTEGTEQL